VVITDFHDKVLAHSMVAGIPQGLLQANQKGSADTYTIQRIRSDEGIIREIRMPLENGTIGYIRVGLRESFMGQEMAARMQKFLLSTLLVCVVGALFSSRVTAMITNPLRSLADSARKIRDGKLDAAISVTGSDEVGMLGVVLQDMQSSLFKTNTERNQLVEELCHKEEMHKILLNKVITIQEEERQRISRELHDETGQALATLMLSMQIMADSALDEKQRKIIMGSSELAANTLQHIRSLAVELRPPLLDDFGFVAAVNKYITAFQTLHGIPVALQATGAESLVSAEINLALYRILQESLTNIAKHAAASLITITLIHEKNLAILEIADNGRGFDVSALKQAYQENHIGIFGMKERMELLGGKLEIQSEHGQGTTVRATVPTATEKGEQNG